MQLVKIVNDSDQRKSRIKAALKGSQATYGTRGQFRGILDAFHGETAFGIDPAAHAPLVAAWQAVLAETASLTEPNGSAYDKKQPKILRELAARWLFDGFGNISPDEILVCPYSSTIMLEEAFATVAEPGAVLLSPEGFYKSNALHVSKYELTIETFPVGAEGGFKIIPATLRRAIRDARKKGPLAALLLTMPGNPILVEYTKAELEALAVVIVEEDVRVIVDAAFDKSVPEQLPLGALSVKVRGRTVSMFDRVLTITGNSKSYGAVGPCKLGAACTGDAAWRERIAARLTTAFQRETTHLVRVLFESTTEAYFASVRELMESQQRLARAKIAAINAAAGETVLTPFPVSERGMFANVEFSAAFAAKAGVSSSLELEDFVLLAQGVNTTCFARMGSPLMAVRLNVLAPRGHGVKAPRLVDELFDRIDQLVRAVQGGLTYADVLRQTGMDPIEPAATTIAAA